MTGQSDCYRCLDFETVGTTAEYSVVQCSGVRKGFPHGCDDFRPDAGVDNKHGTRSYLGIIQSSKKLLFKENP
jgi:hypothetical protein